MKHIYISVYYKICYSKFEYDKFKRKDTNETTFLVFYFTNNKYSCSSEKDLLIKNY